MLKELWCLMMVVAESCCEWFEFVLCRFYGNFCCLQELGLQIAMKMVMKSLQNRLWDGGYEVI